MAQVTLLRGLFRDALGEERCRLLDVSTIDGFQGREKEVVIFSAVRALEAETSGVGGGKRGIGFVADERRINVGLTRARCSLLVVGHGRSLRRDPRWANLLLSALQRGCLYRPSKPYTSYLQKQVTGEYRPVAFNEREVSGYGLEAALTAAAGAVAAKAGADAAAAAAADGGGGGGGEEGGAVVAAAPAAGGSRKRGAAGAAGGARGAKRGRGGG